MTRQSYLINKFSDNEDHIVVKYSSGGYINDPEEVRALARGLYALAAMIERAKLAAKSTDEFAQVFDQDEYRRMESTELARKIAMNGKWQFSDIVSERADDFTDSPSTYFANTKAYPNLVKIGSAQSPLKRMSELRKEHFDEPFVILALCQTERFRDLEQYLKHQFVKSRIFGEFYRKQPIMWYLGYIQGLLKDRQEHDN